MGEGEEEVGGHMDHQVLCPHCKKPLPGLPYLESKDGIAMFFCPNCSTFLSAWFIAGDREKSTKQNFVSISRAEESIRTRLVKEKVDSSTAQSSICFA